MLGSKRPRGHGHTEAGTPLTDELIEKLADEAEAGYDVDEILGRRGKGGEWTQRVIRDAMETHGRLSPGPVDERGYAVTFDRDAFVDECRRALAEDSQQLAVREVVERAVSEPAAVAAEFGVADRWRIDVLHNEDDLTILHFVWPPSVDLFPHEHKMWSTVGIYGGVEDNTYFRRTGDSIEVSGHKRGDVGDVLLLGADGIHSVRNPTRQWTAALHVYGGDFFSHPRLQWDPETGDSKPFDVQNARAVLAAADAQARVDGIA